MEDMKYDKIGCEELYESGKKSWRYNDEEREEWSYHSRISRSWLKRAEEQFFWNNLGVSIKYSN